MFLSNGFLLAALVIAAKPGTHEVRLGTEWVPLARGPATVSVVSFVPVKSSSPGLTVYGFKLAPDPDCRGEAKERVPQPNARGEWGPYKVPKDRTLCVTTSGGAGGSLRYSAK